MDVRFLSSNPHKIREVQEIMMPAGVRVIAVSRKVEELQTEDVTKLVRDKLLKAFDEIGRPLFVEHTGIHVDGLNGLPGGLTQIFWDSLGADSFVKLVAGLESNRVVARTVIGYCDARKINFFEGQIVGHVPDQPRGPRNFQWDCVFMPEGSSRSFAEMGEEKNKISMRRIALDKLAVFLRQGL